MHLKSHDAQPSGSSIHLQKWLCMLQEPGRNSMARLMEGNCPALLCTDDLHMIPW